MRVLVAGASGAIGKPLAVALHAEGHEVVTLSRSSGDLRAAAPTHRDGIALLKRDGAG
jgi:nucleoside-diphosphate-sugar epimerase